MANHEQTGFLGALRQLWGHLRPKRRVQFFRVLALMLLGALAELVLLASTIAFLSLLSSGSLNPQTLGPLSPIIGSTGLSQAESIATIAPFFVLAVLLVTAIRLVLSWSNLRFVMGVGHDLASETQRRIVHQPYAFHIERSTSELIASLDKIQLLVFGVLQQAMTTFIATIIGAAIIATLIAVDAGSALIALAILGLAYGAVSRFTRSQLARNSDVVGTAFDHRVRMIQESSGGIRDLIIDQSQPIYLSEFRRIDRQLAYAQATTSFIAGAPRFLIEGAALMLVAALSIVLSGREGGLAGALPVLGGIALGGMRMMPLLHQAFAGWATMAANRSVIGQVLDLLALPLPEAPATDAPLPFANRVDLKEVSYTYPTRSEPALADVSMTVRRGDRIALVGETGSGKSTLADLFMGLLRPQSGSLLVDGVPVETGNVGAWQRNIAHVSQTLFLADASIARNIAFSVSEAEVDMDRVRRAAEVAEIDSFIATLPQGFETKVGERGVRLSGGQRQRIAIARALYKDAPVLVLDEATNALDPETERKVLANLFEDPDRTIVLIAHRPAALGNCRVVRLKDGRLIDG